MAFIIVLFVISIISSGLTSYFHKNIAGGTPNNMYSFMITAMWMFLVSIVFLIVSAITNDFTFSVNLILTAILSGISMSAAIILLTESLRKGSYTITIIIVNLNFYVPIILSLIFLNETATILQLAGILIVTIVIIIINVKNDSPVKKDNTKSIIYACIACISNGLVNFGIKLQQYWSPGHGQNMYYFILYFSAAVICFAVAFAMKRYHIGSIDKAIIKKTIPYALCLGLCIAVCFYPQSILSGIESINAATQFSVTITGSLILSLILGWIKYKEKITCKNMISLILCLTAVVFQILSY
jgi:Predicted membrane protein